MLGTRIGFAALVLAFSSAALAENHQGLYVGAGLGDFSTNVDNVDNVGDLVNGTIDFDRDGDASKVFAGWRFNRVFAAQLDYVDFGTARAALDALNLSAETTGITPSLVGTLPIGPVELFARAGMIFYDVKVRNNGSAFIDDSGNDPVYGAGIGVTLLERLSLRAEYEKIDISDLADADAVWLTAAWRF
ncbi:MAG TPA: outer membrane beta-barrel protein [Gammaproteobacteria bacterium]|nr:outer membrane beta-barrel protein [Gammaproteobacteria bacterium]